MATEVTKSVRTVSDITGDRLNPNQAASVSITVGQKVYKLDAEKANEHVSALIAAAPVTEKKRGRKPGSKNSTEATQEATQEASSATESATEDSATEDTTEDAPAA